MGGTPRCPRLRAGLDGKGLRVQGSCPWPRPLAAIAQPAFLSLTQPLSIFFVCLFVFCLFETGSHTVALTVLELSKKMRPRTHKDLPVSAS